MALTHKPRRRVPLDGSSFRTMTKLNSMLAAASHYNERVEYPAFVGETLVPVIVRMVPHIGQATRTNPSAVYYHPVVRIGVPESPEVELTSDAYAAGIFRDQNLDGWDEPNAWHYWPIPGDPTLPDDSSVYECDRCEKWLYRDDRGVRFDHSACLYNGELVCRDCDYRGAIFVGDGYERLERCRTLAAFIGVECFDHLNRCVADLSREESWGPRPSQTRFYPEDSYSWCWNTRVRVDGEWKRSINGGLIMHGPHVKTDEDGHYTFTSWDYLAHAARPATEQEIRGIRWGVHT